VAFLRSFTGHTNEGFTNEKKAFYVPQTGGTPGGIPYKGGWDINRGISQALDRTTWVYKAVYAIAANSARLPIALRKGDWRIGELTWDADILQLLNRQANPAQDAFSFRFMLSSQLLLSNNGAFVEIIRNRIGEVTALVLLQPQYTFPIPDKDTFVSGFSVEYPNTPKRVLKPEDCLWIRVPHPTQPYKSQTPLEAAGLAIEFDYYARVYNRNFVVNDARPGGLLVIGGDIDDEQSEELKRRFSGSTGSNIGGAGRLTVMAAETAQFIDTTTNQRDAQYQEARMQNKEEILIAFGVPETVIGNASNRTFANSDTELEVFWRETMLPHLTLLERAFDKLDEDLSTYFSYDLSSVAILSRDDRDRSRFHLEELKQGAISIDEYRNLTGRDAVGIDELLIPTNLSPVVMQTNNSASPNGDGQPLNPNQRPGRRPAGSPDKPVPDGQTSSQSAQDNRVDPTNNEPSPRAVYTPPLTELGLEFGEFKSSEDAGTHRMRQLNRLEQSVGLQVGSLFKRQERVVLEKASSKKSKEKWDSAEKLKVEDIFDSAVWDRQLTSDAKTWMSSVFLDGVIEMASNRIDSLDMDEQKLEETLSPRLKTILRINETTKSNIQRLLDECKDSTHAEFVLALRQWMNSSFTKRVKTIAVTEVGGAFNAGLIWAAKQLGYSTKTWVHLASDTSRSEHANLASTTVSIDDPFIVSGKSVQYPGDPEHDDNHNCRCTLLFS